MICKTWSKSCSKIARDVHQLREPGLIGWQVVQKVFLLSSLSMMIYYDAKITLNMYFHGITQTFQIQMLLLNCMMICISVSLRFCVKRFPNSSMSAKVNIGSYCKFYVCYTDWRNGVLLSGTENHKHIKNSVSARITANFNRLFEEVGFYRAGPWTVGEEKLVFQHLDKWTIMICGCWPFMKDMLRKPFPEWWKWNKGCRYRCCFVLYPIFWESASQQVWPGTENHEHTNQLTRTV